MGSSDHVSSFWNVLDEIERAQLGVDTKTVFKKVFLRLSFR